MSKQISLDLGDSEDIRRYCQTSRTISQAGLGTKKDSRESTIPTARSGNKLFHLARKINFSPKLRQPQASNLLIVS